MIGRVKMVGTAQARLLPTLRRLLICPTGKSVDARENLSIPWRKNIPLVPSGKSAVAHENLSIPSRKNISLVPSGKSPPLVLAVPHPKEGRTRNRHGRWVRDAMDALVSQGERYKRGRQSRVVLAPRRWCQVCG
jgi:hypothetical protein